jgi:hypothetical protein
MDNVKILRLQSGEDIITQYTENEKESTLLLSYPMIVIFKRMSEGRCVMFMSPWLPVELVEHNFTSIYMQDVLTVFEPKQSLLKYYEKAVSKLAERIEEEAEMIDSNLTSGPEDSQDYDVEDEDDGEGISEESTITVTSNKVIH